MNARGRRCFHWEDGFTVLELMIVVAILAVVIAMAMFSYVGYRSRAFNVVAKESASLALKTAKTVYVDGSYLDVTPMSLKASEAAIDFVDAATFSTGPEVASVESPNAQTFVASVLSQSGTCYFIMDNLLTGIQFGTLDTGGPPGCNAGNSGLVAFGSKW